MSTFSSILLMLFDFGFNILLSLVVSIILSSFDIQGSLSLPESILLIESAFYVTLKKLSLSLSETYLFLFNNIYFLILFLICFDFSFSVSNPFLI